MSLDILKGMAEIFIFFGIGVLASKVKVLRHEDIGRFSNFSFNFLYPPLIFSTIIKGLDRAELKELWPLPFAGFLLMAGGGLLGIVLAFGMRRQTSIDRKRTFRHICAINNFGFLPIILITKLWGDDALADLFVLNMGSYLGAWTIGIALLGESHPKAILKKLINPTLITLVFSLILVIAGGNDKVPLFITDLCGKLGASTVQIMLILVGATLAQTGLKLPDWNVVYVVFVRVVLIPAISIGLLYLLPLDFRLFRVAAVVAIMPAAATSAVMTRTYGGDPEYAASAVLITTVLSIVTIPLFMQLIMLAE